MLLIVPGLAGAYQSLHCLQDSVSRSGRRGLAAAFQGETVLVAACPCHYMGREVLFELGLQETDW